MKKMETKLSAHSNAMFIRNIYECDFINYLGKKYPVYLIDKKYSADLSRNHSDKSGLAGRRQ